MTNSLERDAAFSPDSLASDLEELRRILFELFRGVSVSDWERPTEKDPGGWTLRQALAHVTVAAERFLAALGDTLAQRPFSTPGLTSASDLISFNEREIAGRNHVPPEDLVRGLLEALDATAARARTLTSEQLAMSLVIPAYNRPLTVAELVGAQLAHAGIVHAAQLTNGAGARPLWTSYEPEPMRRQITRAFNLISHAYLPERGGDLYASVNFTVSGKGGGRWYLTLAPDGGASGEGRVRRPPLTIWVRSPHALCSILTSQISVGRAVATGKAMAWGDLRLAFRLPHLFLGTR